MKVCKQLRIGGRPQILKFALDPGIDDLYGVVTHTRQPWRIDDI